ncbi:MAG: aldo/keto reductase [Candidatus Lokiarchaeia archaeon]
MNISKITLGTAQLGMNYGIANVSGKPEIEKALKILNYAWENGINSFESSPLYGNSEKIIGLFISELKENLKKDIVIISKLPAVKNNCKLNYKDIYEYIKNKIKISLNNLKLNCIPIYLLHHAPDINIKDGLVIKCLNQIKKEGLINQIGISIYNLKEVEEALKFREIDIIQLPLNIFDHRLIKSGLLKRLNKYGYTILARSIYLQGLFFLSPEKLPDYLKIAKQPLLKLRDLAREYHIDIAKLAFLYVRDLSEITSLVIGAENVNQLANNLKFLDEKALSSELSNILIEEFSDLSDKIINPSLWNK